MTRRRTFFLSALAGAAAALGHAPFGLWPVAVLGFAALSYLVSRFDRPLLAGWAGGVGYFATALHWIVQPFLVDVARHGWMAPFALLFMATGLALFWAAAGWLAARAGGNRAIGWALALSAAELARGYVLTGFPWALPAYIWTDTWVRGAAADIGPYGLTALTLLATSLPAAMRLRWAGAALGATLLAGLAVSHLPAASSGDTLGTVRLVQPNAPQREKWDPDRAHFFVERQIGYTAAPKDGVDLIVWPETALPYWFHTAEAVYDRMAEVADGVPVIFGVNRAEMERMFNALAVLGPDGKIAETYDKVRLVPFGEYIPFGQLARLVGLGSFAARDGYGFSSGAGVHAIDTPLGRALPLICYEVIFPQHIRALDRRPDYLLQITNDAWFGTFSGPYQHLQQARFRAVEQGLPLVRVANTGVSAVVDPEGRIVQSLPLGETGYLDVAVPAPLGPTLYARTGDAPVALTIFVLLFGQWLRARRNGVANPARSK